MFAWLSNNDNSPKKDASVAIPSGKSVAKQLSELRKLQACNKKLKNEDSPKQESKLATTCGNSVAKELCELRKLQECNKKLKFTNIITDVDVLNIYKDVGKIDAIENYLHILYSPFECRLQTDCQLDLAELATHLANTIYDATKSSALHVRFTQPTCSLRIYSDGSMTCQGIDYESAVTGCQNVMALMENIGFRPKCRKPNFNVVNATFRVPFPINLRKLYINHLPRSCYNLRTQPYLLYEIKYLKIKLAIFPMGHVYVMLSSQPSYTREAIALILPILYRYREQVVQINESDMSIGDINFQLLWEHNLQKSYHKSVPNYFKNSRTL